MSDTSQSGVRRISGSGLSDGEATETTKKLVNDVGNASGVVSRASGDANAVGAPTTTISTIAVQSGDTRIVLALLQSGEWLELRVVELSPGLVYLGSTLEEATALQKAHLEVLTKLQSQQSPVEDLLNQADQLISTQRPRAEVYAAMAESLGLAWRDLNSHLETRKILLDMSVIFHTRARQYSDAMDAAEKVYTDNVMPTDVEAAKRLLTTLHDHKRGILESSMYTLQEAHVLLGRLKGLLQEGGSMDSRPQHIRTNIEFACSQIEHYLESLHDRRRFLDGLYTARKHHLEQCLALCVLYQDLTEAILSLKKLRDEISEHQDLGTSQANSEILLHEHLRRENAAKAQQDQCVRHVRTAEQMVASGHYAGAEARARAYSVLEAATALHETCDTRTALLEQAGLFFKLASGALTKLDQAEVQVAGLSTQGGNQRLSVVMGVVEEAVQPALTEGYALLEVTGGRGQPHNQGVTDMVEQLESRRTRLSSLCAESTEKVLQKTELINSFLEMYNAIESWLIKIGDSFLRGHQDPGGSLSLAKDFLHLHLTLKNDLLDKSQEIDTVSAFLDQLSKELPDDELIGYRDKVENIRKHWSSLNGILESRIKLSETYVKFHEDAEKINSEFEDLEVLLKNAKTEADKRPIEEKWQKIQQMYHDLLISGKQFIKLAKEADYPYLDINRAILCVEYILENLGKRKLVVTDLFTHYQQKITIYKELASLWNTYKENLKKMEKEMQNLEDALCPLLRGDPSKPEDLADNLESRLSIYVKAVRSLQEDIQNMVTKAEGLAHNDEAGAERPEIVRSLLQLYQNLQNKATDYQILGTMLIQWCKNISEVHRSCDKMERQFGGIPPDASAADKQLRELDASKHAVTELLKFAQHEADAIIQKIRVQCPYEAGGKDIAKMKEMLERRRKIMVENWTERQVILEMQLKKSQYQKDLKAIRDQLRDLNDQLNRMKGHYGDSLSAALNMRSAFNQFKQTVDVLGRRINNFVSTAEKMLLDDQDPKTIQFELNDLQNKWSTFQMQVGSSQKSIELSIEYFKLIDEAESWFKQGSQLLITVAGESSQIQTPEQADKLQQKIESFLSPGEIDQSNRITKISSLAFQLYGDTAPQQVEAVSQQNKFMLESFNVINRNLQTLMMNLKLAEEQRKNQEKEQQELAASLAQAQAEAENARLAALAAEEARKVAEETVTAMAMHKITASETVEVVVQTDPEPEPQPQPQPIIVEELPPVKKVKIIEEETVYETLIPPMFLTPLVGATVSEGVKFTFECRITGSPTPDVEWLKDGLSIMSNPDYRTSFDGTVCALTIEETFTEDSALFTCRARNKCGVAESSATLIVKESPPTEVLSAPSFSKRLTDSTIQEGSSFQLEANVTGHPLPVVSWSKNSVCIDHSPDYIITYNNGECILRFEEVFLEDEAEYTCRATNDLGEDVTKAKLSVAATIASEKPSFPVPLSNLMARAGQKFKLECEVKGTPTPSLAWFHNNKQVKETPDCKISFDGKTASLVISEAFPKNAGKYTLVAKNTAGEAKTFSNVSVKGRIPTETSDSEITSDIDAEPIKPSVQQPLKDILAKEGEMIRLDCIIIGQPEPEVIWYHDDKPVKESEDIRLLFHGDRCSLVIEEAFIEDIGEYKVVAMNSAGEASTSCNVSVEVPEKVPVLPPAEVPLVIAAPPPAEPPRFSFLLVDTHVMEGEPVILKASVSGSPKPTIAWFKDGAPVLPDNQLQIYEEPDGFVKIHIPHTNLDHTGQYEVVASNCVGTAKCIGFLSIEQRLPTPTPPEPTEPPGFTKLLEDLSIESGNSVTLEAEVTGKPKPLVSYCLGSSNKGILSCAIGLSELDLSESIGKDIESNMKRNLLLLDSDSANSDENEGEISAKFKLNDEVISKDIGLYISSITQHVSNDSFKEEKFRSIGNIEARSDFRDIKVLDHDVYKKYLENSFKEELPVENDQELSDSSFEKHEKERENSPSSCNISSSLSPSVPSRLIDSKKLEELWKIVQEQYRLLNVGERNQLKINKSRDSGYYSDRNDKVYSGNLNEVRCMESPENFFKLSDSKDNINYAESLLTSENKALSQDITLSCYKNKNSCDLRSRLIHDDNGLQHYHSDTGEGYYVTENIEYNHLENCNLKSKYLAEENIINGEKGRRNKPKSVKRSETLDLLHLLFEDKYEDAYISKVCLDTEKPKSDLSLVPDISSKDIQIRNFPSKYFSFPRVRGRFFKTLDGRYCRSLSRLEVINEETFSDWEEFGEVKEDDSSLISSLRKPEGSGFIINISPNNGNGFYSLKTRSLCENEKASDYTAKLVKLARDFDFISKSQKENQISNAQLQRLKTITEKLKSPSKLSRCTTDGATAVNSFLKFKPIYSHLKLRPTKSVIPFHTSLNMSIKTEGESYKENSQTVMASDGIFFFVMKVINKITLTEMKRNIIEKLSVTFKSGSRVLHTYILSFGGLSGPTNTNINPLSITKDTLSNCVYHFIMKSCELATVPQSVIHTGEYSDPTVPYFVQAGFYLIYVLCYKDGEQASV